MAFIDGVQQAQDKVLIVDDVPVNRMLLTKILTKEGYSCKVACDGVEALIEFQQWHPDIALLDIQMPGMDGYEVLRWINAKPNIKDRVPVIAVTANNGTEEVDKLMSLGAAAVCNKPIITKQLKELLRQHIVHH